MKCKATLIYVFFIITIVCSTGVPFGQGTDLGTIRPEPPQRAKRAPTWVTHLTVGTGGGDLGGGNEGPFASINRPGVGLVCVSDLSLWRD
jgi:hypothetical protein